MDKRTVKAKILISLEEWMPNSDDAKEMNRIANRIMTNLKRAPYTQSARTKWVDRFVKMLKAECGEEWPLVADGIAIAMGWKVDDAEPDEADLYEAQAEDAALEREIEHKRERAARSA